jgi:hypothetical protein
VETYANRSTLRDRLAARLGEHGDTLPSVAIGQRNEWLRSAQLKVAEDMPWATGWRSVKGTLAIDQRWIDYPAYCNASAVRSLAIWVPNSNGYTELTRAPIGVRRDDDELVLGTDASIALRNQPRLFECRTREDTNAAAIKIWPRPEQAYAYKLEFQAVIDFADDTTESLFDAECILLYALAMAYEEQGDMNSAGRQIQRAEARIRQIKASQANMTSFSQTEAWRASVRTHGLRTTVPDNSGSWPSVAAP